MEVNKMDNKPFTYDELHEAMKKLKSKEEIHVNQQTYNAIIEKLDYLPLELKVNNYIPVNQAIILDIEEIEQKLFRSFGIPSEYLNDEIL